MKIYKFRLRLVGHKSKLCKYYHCRGGQGRHSKLQHPESGKNSDSIKSQDTNVGVLVNNIQCLTIVHLNVRSLLPKIDEIRCILNSCNFDVFAVCESWLNQTIMDSEIVVDGYTVHRKDRPNSIGGGVCLYVKNDYTFTVSNDLMFDDVKALWGELKLDSINLLISVTYRSPSSGSIYFDSLLDMIENASKKELDMIILGDMNYAYVINEFLHSNLIHYIESLYDMCQLITEKTRVTSSTESTLDLILTTNPSLHKRCDVIKKTLSDHYMTSTELAVPKKVLHGNHDTVTFRNYNHFDDCEFINVMKSNDLLNGNCKEVKWNEWKDAFLHISNAHAPTKTARLKVRSNTWITRDIVKMMYDRDRIHELAVKRKDTVLIESTTKW